jgi:hypothetical protein
MLPDAYVSYFAFAKLYRESKLRLTRIFFCFAFVKVCDLRLTLVLQLSPIYFARVVLDYEAEHWVGQLVAVFFCSVHGSEAPNRIPREFLTEFGQMYIKLRLQKENSIFNTEHWINASSDTQANCTGLRRNQFYRATCIDFTRCWSEGFSMVYSFAVAR